MFGRWKDRITGLMNCDQQDAGPETPYPLIKDFCKYISLSSYCVLLLGFFMYLVINVNDFFENFFHSGHFINGLAAGAFIGLILHRNQKKFMEDRADEDEELAKQKAAEALGFIDYRSYRA